MCQPTSKRLIKYLKFKNKIRSRPGLLKFDERNDTFSDTWTVVSGDVWLNMEFFLINIKPYFTESHRAKSSARRPAIL